MLNKCLIWKSLCFENEGEFESKRMFLVQRFFSNFSESYWHLPVLYTAHSVSTFVVARATEVQVEVEAAATEVQLEAAATEVALLSVATIAGNE